MSRYVIDRKKLDENIETVKKKAGVPVIGVVKGNGYGFGLQNLAKVLQAHGIHFFAVTEVDDIAPLRAVAPAEDILVMRSTCIEEEARRIVEAGCTATVGSPQSAEVLSAAAKKAGVRAKAHVKIDTGLGRYGFLPSEIESLLQVYKTDNIDFTGIYTHFSSAFTNKALTQAQLVLFKDTAEQLRKNGIDPGMMHAANSPALFNASGAALDAVRIGSAFTGRLITQAATGLHRIGMLEAEIVDVKNVPAGYSVGYNGLFKTTRPTKLAIVPFGHYDGFGIEKATESYTLHTVLRSGKRFLKKEKLFVTVGGKKYPVAGEVGLSHTAIDVTGSDIQPGDIASADISPLFANPLLTRKFI